MPNASPWVILEEPVIDKVYNKENMNPTLRGQTNTDPPTYFVQRFWCHLLSTAILLLVTYMKV